MGKNIFSNGRLSSVEQSRGSETNTSSGRSGHLGTNSSSFVHTEYETRLTVFPSLPNLLFFFSGSGGACTGAGGGAYTCCCFSLYELYGCGGPFQDGGALYELGPEGKGGGAR